LCGTKPEYMRPLSPVVFSPTRSRPLRTRDAGSRNATEGVPYSHMGS
jgi:hypothetical protein